MAMKVCKVVKGISSKSVTGKKTKPTLARSQKETGEFGDLVIVCLLCVVNLFIVGLNVHLFCGFLLISVTLDKVKVCLSSSLGAEEIQTCAVDVRVTADTIFI